MSSTIPTAEKFVEGKEFSIPSIYNMMIEFAKLHVTAAIAECIDCAPTSSTDDIYRSDVVECLTDCYPLDNIK